MTLFLIAMLDAILVFSILIYFINYSTEFTEEQGIVVDELESWLSSTSLKFS